MTLYYLLAIALSLFSCQFQKNNNGVAAEVVDKSLVTTNENEGLEVKPTTKELEKISSNASSQIQSDVEVSDVKKEHSTSPKPETTDDAVQKNEEIIEEDLVSPEVVAVEQDDIPKEMEQTINHSIWNKLLKQYVSASGKVDYPGMKKNGELEKYLDILSNTPPLSSWSENTQLAYWINVYNAFTVKLIIDHYPIASITNLHNGKPWDVKWITIGSNTYSLNQIENEIIRPQFKEPRIHFAVNCAAMSCPPLTNKAYTGGDLEKMLEENTKAFINNPQHNIISGKKVEISKIFDWYKEDFGDLIEFLNQYTKTQIKGNASITFKEYNWALNNK